MFHEGEVGVTGGGGYETDGGGLPALRRLSAAIGADPRLVQGAGGNVSIKSGTTMWIKASGTWLADALARDIMVPVMLPPQSGDRFVVLNKTDLRPSIETSMHASLPHTVILHVHSVDAIALAVRADAAALLGTKLEGLRWAFIPYCRPGLQLSRAIREAASCGRVDVLVLGNHGLVVAADDVAAAGHLLAEVVARLSTRPREAVTPSSTLAAILADHQFHPPADPATHSLATDPVSMAIAVAGVLFPDQAVFLGSAPLVVDRHENLGVALARSAAAGLPRPRWAIVRNVGVAVADDLARGGEETLRCLAAVSSRIPAGAALSFLGAGEIAALTNWEAERYRQEMERQKLEAAEVGRGVGTAGILSV